MECNNITAVIEDRRQLYLRKFLIVVTFLLKDIKREDSWVLITMHLTEVGAVATQPLPFFPPMLVVLKEMTGESAFSLVLRVPQGSVIRFTPDIKMGLE